MMNDSTSMRDRGYMVAPNYIEAASSASLST